MRRGRAGDVGGGRALFGSHGRPRVVTSGRRGRTGRLRRGVREAGRRGRRGRSHGVRVLSPRVGDAGAGAGGVRGGEKAVPACARVPGDRRFGRARGRTARGLLPHRTGGCRTGSAARRRARGRPAGGVPLRRAGGRRTRGLGLRLAPGSLLARRLRVRRGRASCGGVRWSGWGCRAWGDDGVGRYVRARGDRGAACFRAHAPPVSSCPGRRSRTRADVRLPGGPARTRWSLRGTHTRTGGPASRRGRPVGAVPPCVRVTLRLVAGQTGTSPRPRGLLPGTSPYPAVIQSGRLRS